MQRKIITTADGSHSIEILGAHTFYHSLFGAIRESQHIYIETGLKPLLQTRSTLKIFEMGFGTGLNALLTFMEAEKYKQKIYYEAVELFPLEQEFITELNYCEKLQRPDLEKTFLQLHSCPWDIEIILSPHFSFKKIKTSLTDHEFRSLANLI